VFRGQSVPDCGLGGQGRVSGFHGGFVGVRGAEGDQRRGCCKHGAGQEGPVEACGCRGVSPGAGDDRRRARGSDACGSSDRGRE
jgi:hypothetical protein